MTDLQTQHLPDYDTAVTQTTAEMQRLLRTAPPVIRHLTRHLAKASGKMIRARALLACALLPDGRVRTDAVRAAAAAELLHLATLVHDDILDDADKRRGIETLHRKFGEKHAVLCGDYLFCTALEFVSAVMAPPHRSENLTRTFPHYLTAVCLGELRQSQNNHNYRLSEREYFKIIHGKTAALFEACFYAGFILSDAPDAEKDAYTEIGGNIGLIFQLSDDCADYTSTSKITKKPVLSDYSRGVITLPLIHAMKRDKTLAAQVQEGMDPAALKQRVENAGGLAYTLSKVEQLYQRTAAQLAALTLRPDQHALLMALLCKSAGKPAV